MQTLYACAYVAGGEVLLRIAGGASYEFAKYAVFIFTLLGICYSGFSRKSWIYLLYAVLLLPSLLVSNKIFNLSMAENKVLLINLAGPICLTFLSIYAYGKKVNFEQISHISLVAALPIVSIATLVYLKSPNINSITGVTSNNQFSGQFGPNQVSTALGLGMFLFYMRAILNSGSVLMFVLNLLTGSLMAYTGLLTFSRAGMITGFCATIAIATMVYFKSKDYGRSTAKNGIFAIFVCFISVFSIVSYSTDGLLVKRYTNRDHLGRIKKDKQSDRFSLASREVSLFVQNPLLGVSLEDAAKARRANENRKVQSHDELTRMLAEHGLFGAMGVVILIFTPSFLFFYKRHNIFLAAFFVVWFFTINHSGMRLVAPAFFYSLMLLNVDLSNVLFFHDCKISQRSRWMKRFYVKAANSV